MAIDVSRVPGTEVKDIIVRLVREESGQDLIEYALLTAFIGLAGMAVFQAIRVGIFNAYTSWDSGTQNLWEPPPPSVP